MGGITWNYNSVILLIISCSCHAMTLESIYWNSSNTKFTPGQGLVLYPQIGDKMDIVCPRAGGLPGGKGEFYRVYLVTRGQMERCSIDNTETPLLNCDKPHKDVKFTFKFQEFSPNLWGLEFLKGRDYYITSTSTSTLQGLDNTNGGVCRTKSMKLVLRVGQSYSDQPSVFQESPTRFPPKQPKPRAEDPSSRRKGGIDNSQKTETETATEAGADASPPSGGSEPGLLIGVVSGCVLFILVIMPLLALLWRYHQRHVPDNQQSASMSLNTLAMPKRNSISSENESGHSDIIFPLRASESMFCHHYERVSSDYGPPVYIVQEIPPQSPTNIYYKV